MEIIETIISNNNTTIRIVKEKDGYHYPQLKHWLFGWNNIRKREIFCDYEVFYYSFWDLSDARHFSIYEQWKIK